MCSCRGRLVGLGKIVRALLLVEQGGVVLVGL